MEDNRNSNQMTQQNTGDNNQDTKTFTQDEVNEIVQRRLAKDRKNRGDDPLMDPAEKALRDREKALQDKENEMLAKELFAAHNMPEDLLEIVKGRGKEETENIIKILKPYIDKASEPIKNPVSNTGSRGPVDAIRKAMGLDR